MPHDPSTEFVALQRAVAGRFSLARELGRGGMGIVFLARDVALDRLVAIKLLPPALAGETAIRARFLREARTAAGLSHPHIVPIHSVEEHGDLVFFVMGHIDGETLGERVRRTGPLPTTELVRVIQEITWALGHAHARGVVHRDVKPDNVLLERATGRALVADFGIARVATEDGATPATGSIIGTPEYLSPEQGAGAPGNARSDLYALGVTAFFAATGRLPFEASTVTGLLAKHSSEAAPAFLTRAPDAPPRFGAAIDRCLAKDPAERFESAEELAEDLAAARGTLAEIPPALRRFVREADPIGGEAGGYLGGAVVTALILQALKIAEGDFFGMVTALQVIITMLLVGVSGSRVAQLVPLALDLLKGGYDHDATRAALELEERRRREEAESTAGGASPWLTAAAGVAATGLGVVLMSNTDLSDLLQVMGWALVIGAPSLTLRQLFGRVRGSKFWNRLLRGRLGRWAFKLGGVGIGDVAPPALPTGEPTALAIGRAAGELFAALPESQRKRLAEIPELIERLEADVLSLRAGADQSEQHQRLTTAVTALEALRLDLMRLHAGKASLDELTQDIAKARRIGDAIDAEMKGRDDVGKLLADE